MVMPNYIFEGNIRRFSVKKYLIAAAVVLIVVSGIFIYANAAPKNTIAEPDKILIYRMGNVIEVKKEDPKFNELVKLTNDRFKGKKITITGHLEPAILEKGMKNIEKGMEFIYSTPQSFKVKGDKTPQIYSKLFFELQDLHSSAFGQSGSDIRSFYYGIDSGYSNYDAYGIGFPNAVLKAIN